MGVGLVGVRRLMDRFEIDVRAGAGTTVLLGKTLPRSAPGRRPGDLRADRRRAGPPGGLQDPLEEVRRQNQELLQTLEELTPAARRS